MVKNLSKVEMVGDNDHYSVVMPFRSEKRDWILSLTNKVKSLWIAFL